MCGIHYPIVSPSTTKNDARATTWFLYKYVLTRARFPIEIVSDIRTHFINEFVQYLLEEFMIVHKKLAPYHPQANGQEKSMNKIIFTMLTKIVENSRIDWELKLESTLWVYCVTYKTSLGTTPFNIVFGLSAILPLEFLIPTLRVAKELEWNGHEFSKWLEQLENLDEV